MLDRKYKVFGLKNGKKALTVSFGEGFELLGTFFFVEVNAFEDWIRGNICDVLEGRAERRDISGNICELIIGKETAEVLDTLAEDGIGKRCTLPTRELLTLIDEWHERKALM